MNWGYWFIMVEALGRVEVLYCTLLNFPLAKLLNKLRVMRQVQQDVSYTLVLKEEIHTFTRQEMVE